MGSQTQSGSVVAQQPIEYIDENEAELPVDARDYPLERYKPLSIIGEGVSGRVYLSRDRVLGKRVAVKTLRQLSQSELINFQNSAKANSKLTHPRIVQVLDFGVSAQGSPFMVMDYVNGRGLDEVRRENGYFPWQTVFTMMVDLCDALGYAHENGIMHRDLKPSNMLVANINSQHPDICLIDFGVAEIGAPVQGNPRAGIAGGGAGGSAPGAGTVGGPIGGAEATKRMTTQIVGTPAYMSPDTTTGLPYTTRSDIYSLGCVMFECIAGRPPFISDTSLETLKMHAEMEPPALAEVNPSVDIPDDVQEVIGKCLQKRPGNRFHTATELMIALKRVLRAHEREYSPKDTDGLRPGASPVVPAKRRLGTVVWVAIIGLIAIVSMGAAMTAIIIKSDQKPVQQKVVVKPKTATELTRLGSPQKSFDELFEEDEASKGTKFTAKVDLIDSDLKLLLGKNVEQLFLNEQPDITDVGCKILSKLPIQHMLLQARKVTDDGLLSLASIESLRGLGLGQCKITDKGVMALSENLQTLGIAETQITDKCMSHIAKMHGLVLLNVTDGDISDDGLCQLTQLPLMELWIAHTKVTDRSLIALGKGKANLNSLSAVNTRISEKGLRALKHMPIWRLDLGSCENIDDDCIKMLAADFPKLTSLTIDDTSVTPASFKTLAEMKGLTYLRLSRLRFKESDLDPIMTLPNLQNLDVTNTNVTDKIFEKLAKMPNLKEITCNECQHLTVAGLKNAQKRFTIHSTKLLDIAGEPDFGKFLDIGEEDVEPPADLGGADASKTAD